MATYDNCLRCKKGFECGWSFIDPEKISRLNVSQMVDEPCDNLCEPSVFTVDNVNIEGLCRVFEAAAAREYYDRNPTGGKGNRHSPTYNNRRRRR